MTTTWKWGPRQLWKSLKRKSQTLSFSRKLCQKLWTTCRKIYHSTNSSLGAVLGMLIIGESWLPFHSCFLSRYFSVTLLSVFTMYYDSHDVIEFPNSTMGRNLIKVNVRSHCKSSTIHWDFVIHLQAHMGDLKLCLLNSHLESTAEHSAERMNQLKVCFKEMNETERNVNVIFGGDLNMRDKEVRLPLLKKEPTLNVSFEFS